ncbi:MAG TPA: hypothetical protein DCS43_15660 [Verrucomicrobia bacterium]|nr:hypothetical protein [Verrucomicrobiota bacterium]
MSRLSFLAGIALMLATHSAQIAFAQSDDLPRQPTSHEGYGRGGRPADHLLERIRQQNPEQYQRLADLRKTDPEAFGKELRQFAQQRMAQRFFDASPRLREFFKSLPEEEQERILQAIKQGDRSGHPLATRRSSHSHGGEMDPGDGQTPPDDSTPCTTREPGHRSAMSREAIEARYDQRTQFYETEIKRISLQLESLQRMLEERKAARERVIEQLLQKSGKANGGF